MKILVFPKDSNPYQNFLYSGFPKENNFQFDYLTYKISKYEIINLLYLLFITIHKRFEGYNIYHLHFLYNFNYSTSNRLIKYLSLYFYFLYIISYILLLKILGFKLIWTVHSIKTHERQTINDLYITKFIISLSDASILHSKMGLNELKKLKVNLSKLVVIPIGNYNNYYKNTITTESARKKLELSGSDFIFLYFGIIRKYKGIDDLIAAFNMISGKYQNVKLLIVGNCFETELKESILNQCSKNKNIQPFIQFIENNDIQIYLKSANIIVTPYKKITTSSTTLLSFSFHKPIIFPRIGNLRELPKNIGIEYKANNVKDLERAMETAINEREKIVELGENAYKYSRKFDWKDISTTTYKLFQSLK